jgi:hypothetical protein
MRATDGDDARDRRAQPDRCDLGATQREVDARRVHARLRESQVSTSQTQAPQVTPSSSSADSAAPSARGRDQPARRGDRSSNETASAADARLEARLRARSVRVAIERCQPRAVDVCATARQPAQQKPRGAPVELGPTTCAPGERGAAVIAAARARRGVRRADEGSRSIALLPLFARADACSADRRRSAAARDWRCA